MATHSSIFAWRIPWTQEPGGLSGGFQAMGLQRVGHDFAHTHTHVWEEIGYEVGVGQGKCCTVGDDCTMVNILETTKPHTLNGWV